MTETNAPNEELIAGFVEEAMDLLQNLPQRVDDHLREPSNAESVNVVFRSVHTIKGNAGFFGLIALKQFSHKLEDVFDDIRQGRLEMFDELHRCLVESLDALGEMIAEVADGVVATTLTERQSELLNRLEVLSANAQSSTPEARVLAEVLQLARETANARSPEGEAWSARLQALAQVLSGEESSGADHETNADSSQFDAKALYQQRFMCVGEDVTEQVHALLRLFVVLDSGEYQPEDGQAFLDACDAFSTWAEAQEQEGLANALSAARADFQTIFASPIDVDAFLVSVVWDQLQPAVLPLVKQELAAAADPTQAVEKTEKKPAGEPAEKKADAGNKSRILRIREERVDQFLDDVSSLFITCERLKDLQSRMARVWQANELLEELRQINTSLAEQSTELQRSVVEIRKVSVMGLFSKFPRVARTLAANLGKQLNVHIEGEETEIDKSLVEDLDGPLMHMVRNVCDHGIDLPEEREARGVTPDGNMWLKCDLTKSHVLITVRDDGRGIDPNRLRRKAVEKKLMREEQAAALSDQEAIELIFHPGFSTAEQISEISGRGVGLDVVRTRLREYKGDVRVQSKVGVGTTFTLEIPVRKAVVVVDGLLIRQQGNTFVLPFEHIREIVSLSNASVSSVRSKPVVTVRGEPYAALHLAELLGLDQAGGKPTQCHTGVLVRTNSGPVCLLVETVVGQRKVVVNGLSDMLSCSDKLHGVAQLGGGQLALVLNGPDMLGTAASALCI